MWAIHLGWDFDRRSEFRFIEDDTQTTKAIDSLRHRCNLNDRGDVYLCRRCLFPRTYSRDHGFCVNRSLNLFRLAPYANAVFANVESITHRVATALVHRQRDVGADSHLVQDLAGHRSGSFYRASRFHPAKGVAGNSQCVLVIAYTTGAPNVIVGIDKGNMLFHQLRRSGIPKMITDIEELR